MHAIAACTLKCIWCAIFTQLTECAAISCIIVLCTLACTLFVLKLVNLFKVCMIQLHSYNINIQVYSDQNIRYMAIVMA